MTTQEKLEKLQELCGKKVRFQEREFTVLTYKIQGDNVEIITDDQRWVKTDIHNLLVIIQQMKVCTVPDVRGNINIKPTFIAVKNDNIDKIQSALLKMVEEVQKDEASIPKARAIVELSTAMMNAERVKIELVKEANKL